MADRFDIVVVGSGVAALSCALAARDARVCIVTPGTLGLDGASTMAQGGIAAAIGPGDCVDSHVRDTIAAGQGHNLADAVRAICAAAPEAIDWLDANGVAFDRAFDGRYALGREAAHSAHRIVHANGDSTGAAVMKALAAAAKARASIVVRENWKAIAAVGTRRVRGVWCADARGERHAILARHVVLATGGIGGLYRYSTNPLTACGDGLALSQSAGARLADLEFVQFHPTALAVSGDGGPLPLVTEALRGAGATLIDADGRRFMRAQHRDAELAPRDIVARAVAAELAHGNPVFLDARDAIGSAFPERFPGVFALLARHGIDPRHAPIPVTPAQHYHMGGVAVDELGATSVPGLFAIGECAATGVHGANRLASNSLLEGIVFGRRLGETLARHRIGLPWAEPGAAPPPLADEAAARTTIRDTMWSRVGLLRDARGLHEAIGTLEAIDTPRARVCVEIARAALARTESLGAHQRTDSIAPDRAERVELHGRAFRGARAETA